jgi:hypothetical protein
MQRHGGSNRSIPKTKPSLSGRPDERPVPPNDADLAVKSENPVA